MTRCPDCAVTLEEGERGCPVCAWESQRARCPVPSPAESSSPLVLRQPDRPSFTEAADLSPAEQRVAQALRQYRSRQADRA